MLKVLVCLTIATVLVTSFHLNSKNDEIVSLKQFQVLKTLGSGVYGDVYVVKKNGGSDDGQLYAMKSSNISKMNRPTRVDMLTNEREMLEAVREVSGVCRLHYAFNEGIWLFYVIDLATGGSFESRIDASPLDAVSKKLVVAEIVTTIENLHNANIHHRDIYRGNLAIDNMGHVLLIDFGEAKWISDKSFKNNDWCQIAAFCRTMFPKINRGENETSLINLLSNMIDTSKLSELKNHPFFHGIDWEKVAERTCDAPFETPEIHFDERIQLNLTELLQINKDEKLDETVANKIQNFYFVAPEHQPRDDNISE